MRKIYFLVFLSLFFFNSKAQTAAGYYFSTNTYVPLEDLSSGSTIVFGPGQNIDDESSDIISLPFSFSFAGTSYTQFSVSTNGLFGFGPNQVTAVGQDHVIDQSDTYPIVAPWWEDLYTGTNGLVQYKVIGTVNRKFVVEWRERRFSASHLPYNKTFQLWLFEGSNRIQFVYGAGANTFGINSAIGIATSTADFQNVNSPNNTSSTTNDNLSFVWPGKDTSYSFGVTPLLQATVSVNGSSTICGNSPALLTASSTATGSATYQWYKNLISIVGATESTYSASDSGNYSVQVFAQSESAFSSFVAITIAAPAQVAEQHTNVSCHGQQDGAIILTTDSNDVVSWTGPSGFTASTATISSLRGGTYTYTVSNSSQCAPVRGVVTITEPDSIGLTATSTNVSCNNAANGTIHVTTNGTYTIIDGNGNDVTGVSNFGPGTYTINSSIGNCFATPVVVNISQPDILAGSIGSLGNATCNGLANGSITVLGTGGTTPYTFTLNGTGNTSGLFDQLAAGNYNISIADANGCTTSLSFTILQPANLTATSTVTNVTCYGLSTGSANISANGGTSPYNFSLNGSANSTGAFYNLVSGSYSVAVSDANGCSTSINFNITQPNQLVAIANVNNVSCYGGNSGSVSIAASGGTGPFNYSVNGSSNSNGLFTNLSAGAYAAIVTDTNGCSVTVSFTVGQPSLLQATASITHVTCYGSASGSVIIQATGGVSSYNYSLNGINNTTGVFTNLVAGMYTAIVTDTNGCNSAVSFTINQPGQLQATITGNNVSCFGTNTGSAIISATGGTAPYSYSFNSNTNSSGVFNNLSAGSYSGIVTDAKGCSISVSVGITQPSLLTGAASTINVSCFGSNSGAATITANGGTSPYSYVVNGNSNSNGIFNNLSAGSFVATVTDSKGCIQSVPFTITQPAVLTGSAVVVNVICFGTSTGSATISANGGTAPYTFKVNTTTNSTGFFSALPAGSFTATVTDSKGCTATTIFTITQPTQLAGSSTITNVSCFGTNTGATTISATGGTAPYNYSLNGINNATGIFNNLAAGSFTASITDAKGCQVSLSVTVAQPTPLSGSSTITNVSCFGTNTGSATIAANGGTAPYNYSLNGVNNTTGVFNNLSAGSSTVSITDAKGCQASIVIIVSQPTQLAGSSTVTNVACFGTNTGAATIVATGGTSPYSYSLNGTSNNNGIFNNLAAGSFTATITDAHGCVITQTLTINQPARLVGAATSTNVTCYGSNNGSSTISAAGGKTPYTFVLNGSSNSSGIFNSLAASTYTATVTDANGCTANVSIVITQPAALAATVASVNGTCAGANNGSITLSNPTGGSGNYQYNLNGGAWQSSLSFTGLATGNYDVQMRDAANTSCIKDLGIKTISSSGSAPVVSISASEGTFCSNLTLTVNTVGATSYTWSNGSSSGSINLNNSNADGAYSVTVVGQNGCSSSATYTYSKQNILNSYSIVGFSSVTLTKSNNINGSIGNTLAGKKITIGSNSTVTGFVKASVITLSQPVTISGGSFTTPATMTLPAMYLNTASLTGLTNYTVPPSASQTISSNYNQLHISKNAVVTVTGSIYGDITIDDGATVTFTSSDISMNTLNAGNSNTLTVINFAANAIIRIKTYFSLGFNNRVYSSNATIYITDSKSNTEKVLISSKNTWVNANIYIPKGNLDMKQDPGVTAANNSEMIGKFLAENINGADFTDWDVYDCSTATSNVAVRHGNTTDGFLPIVGSTKTDQPIESMIQSVSLYPNPNPGSFALLIKESLPADTKAFIYDSKGSLVVSRTLQYGKGQTLYFQVPNPLPGTYLLKLISKSGNESIKFIIAP